METLISVKQLRVGFKSFNGNIDIIRNVSFDIQQGETLALVGESGSGKSITARSIMGLMNENAIIGEGSKIMYKNQNILEYSEEQWSNYRGLRCSMIFQDSLSSLNPTMKIGKQIEENLLIHKLCEEKDVKQKVINMLKKVKLSNPELRYNQYPHQLSGGMRQRVMIAIATINSPSILIADEPTTALDVTVQAQIMELFKEIQKENNTAIMLITHDLGVVANIADKIAVMYGGQVVENGNSHNIFYKPGHPYTKALLNSVPRLDLDRNSALYTIKGSPPSFSNLPTGCTFSPRCGHCMRICKIHEPPIYEKDGHIIKCWLFHNKYEVKEVFKDVKEYVCRN